MIEIASIIDLISRWIRHPNDYLRILQIHNLVFLKSIRDTEHIHSFFFSTPEGLLWQSGQHGIFTLPKIGDGAKDRTRIFSIASSVTEGHIRISTVISDSPSIFKATLLNLRPGDSITMRGPIGEFHLTLKTEHIIGIAGGIGVTPLRAILKDIVDNNRDDIKVDLLYGSALEARVFTTDFSTWARSPNLSVTYAANKNELQIKLVDLIKNNPTAYYYISGAPLMIQEVKNLLKKQKIRNIINDPFKGYLTM